MASQEEVAAVASQMEQTEFTVVRKYRSKATSTFTRIEPLDATDKTSTSSTGIAWYSEHLPVNRFSTVYWLLLKLEGQKKGSLK